MSLKSFSKYRQAMNLANFEGGSLDEIFLLSMIVKGELWKVGPVTPSDTLSTKQIASLLEKLSRNTSEYAPRVIATAYRNGVGNFTSTALNSDVISRMFSLGTDDGDNVFEAIVYLDRDILNDERNSLWGAIRDALQRGTPSSLFSARLIIADAIEKLGDEYLADLFDVAIQESNINDSFYFVKKALESNVLEQIDAEDLFESIEVLIKKRSPKANELLSVAFKNGLVEKLDVKDLADFINDLAKQDTAMSLTAIESAIQNGAIEKIETARDELRVVSSVFRFAEGIEVLQSTGDLMRGLERA